MIELLNEEIAQITGGNDDGEGGDDGSNFEIVCPNLEAFKRWRELNPFYGY